jgi:hypothetical protein
MSYTFCDKYAPKKMSDILGDREDVNYLEKILKNIDKQKFKCILVTGSHGSGKSCRVNMALRHLNYAIKLINISNFKRADDQVSYLQSIVSCSDISKMLVGDKLQKCVIVIDEMNDESINQEKTQIANIMKINNSYNICPIIFVFDNRYNKMINSLKKGSCEVKVKIPSDNEMRMMLKKIAIGENMRFQNKVVIDDIINFSQYDYRRLCTMVGDMTCEQVDNQIKRITIDIVKKYKEMNLEKDIIPDIYCSTKKILSNYDSIQDCLKIYEMEKVNIPLMVHDNYISTIHLKNYDDINGMKDLTKITEAISMGDVVDNYVYGEQKWDITNVHGFYSCCVPGFYVNRNGYGLKKKADYFVDMKKTSIKKINRKNIILASQQIDSLDPMDYLYINKILAQYIKNDDIDSLIEMMKQYRLTLEKLENIIKIDKTNKDKVVLNARQKRLLKKV